MTSKTRYLAPLALTTALILAGMVTASAKPAPQSDANSSITPGDLGRLDRFFDTHPEIAQRLAQNPALIDNPQYVESQPALEAFLQNHPEISQDLRQNPQAVMKDLVGFDVYESKQAGEDALNARQVTAIDGFLDAHSAIAKQLQANPSLINSKDYVTDHPELEAFLKSHPDLREDWQANPQTAMTDVDRMDSVQDARAVQMAEAKANRDITGKEVESMDAFLDDHPAITAQLTAHPTLITDAGYVDNHPELKQFLQSNPAVAEALRDSPQVFMSDVRRLDARSTSKVAVKTTLNHK